jgi:hypothetical protein
MEGMTYEQFTDNTSGMREKAKQWSALRYPANWPLRYLWGGVLFDTPGASPTNE